jgi:hypothetical protein
MVPVVGFSGVISSCAHNETVNAAKSNMPMGRERRTCKPDQSNKVTLLGQNLK